MKFNKTFWRGLERHCSDQTACNTMAELKAHITLCFKKLQRPQFRSACARFRSRLEKVVKGRGTYFE